MLAAANMGDTRPHLRMCTVAYRLYRHTDWQGILVEVSGEGIHQVVAFGV